MSYADALAYCRGAVARPVALRVDARVFCLDGEISRKEDFSLIGGLEPGGYFVVRSYGGDAAAVIELGWVLRQKQAVVVVDDYCLSNCANFLLIASARAFVAKGALVAWTNVRNAADSCPGFEPTADSGAPRFEIRPCNNSPLDAGLDKITLRKTRFYDDRTLAPPFVGPPQSVTVRRILKRKFDATGKYPFAVFWTWNPRHYPGAIKAKVQYEAYPQSQDEVDAIVARIGLPFSVIYDP